MEAEAYVASVCFKHGPPSLVGVELEWTVHHVDDPRRRLDPDHLAAALGDHAPRTIRPDSPQSPLPSGGTVTVEPGGQVEISSLPASGFPDLIASVAADHGRLADLLGQAGLVLGGHALDQHRTPLRVLDTPRYAAMERAFAPIGSDGVTMMCSTAGLQVCVDVGEPADLPARWNAVTALGPVMIALFANSPNPAGWASGRARAVLGTDPARSSPLPITADPVGLWARTVLDTPLLCVRRAGAPWDAPRGVTFADWIDGALPEPPTTADLDYHLSTLFPPVRPQGYLEVRYLDGQAGAGWVTPAALLAALTVDRDTVDQVVDVCRPAATRWAEAARHGRSDPVIARAAAGVLDLGVDAVARLDLPQPHAGTVQADLARLRDTIHGRKS